MGGPTVGQLSQLAACDRSPSAPLTEITQQAPTNDDGNGHDAPAVCTAAVASYVAWDALVDDMDRVVDSWPEPDDHADTDPAPIASTPMSFLEACKRGGSGEVMTSWHNSTANSMASVGSQQRTAGRSNAAARRPQTAADAGWHTAVGKRGRKSANHSDAAGTKVQNGAQPAAIGSRTAPARVSQSVEQAGTGISSGGAERRAISKSCKKRQARQRRKAQQQQDN